MSHFNKKKSHSTSVGFGNVAHILCHITLFLLLILYIIIMSHCTIITRHRRIYPLVTRVLWTRSVHFKPLIYASEIEKSNVKTGIWNILYFLLQNWYIPFMIDTKTWQASYYIPGRQLLQAYNTFAFRITKNVLWNE